MRVGCFTKERNPQHPDLQVHESWVPSVPSNPSACDMCNRNLSTFTHDLNIFLNSISTYYMSISTVSTPSFHQPFYNPSGRERQEESREHVQRQHRVLRRARRTEPTSARRRVGRRRRAHGARACWSKEATKFGQKERKQGTNQHTTLGLAMTTNNCSTVLVESY